MSEQQQEAPQRDLSKMHPVNRAIALSVQNYRSLHPERNQTWIASRAGVHITTMSQYMRGMAKPSKPTLERLANVLEDPTLLELKDQVNDSPGGSARLNGKAKAIAKEIKRNAKPARSNPKPTSRISETRTMETMEAAGLSPVKNTRRRATPKLGKGPRVVTIREVLTQEARPYEYVITIRGLVGAADPKEAKELAYRSIKKVVGQVIGARMLEVGLARVGGRKPRAKRK